MPGQTLPVFTQSYLESLESLARDGSGVMSYLAPSITVADQDFFRSAARGEGLQPQLTGRAEDDVDDAIRLHQFLRLSRLEASDPRLWAYLAHITFRPYMQKRWPVKGDVVSLGAEEVRASASKLVISRWFTTGKARSLGRHGLSRLWWATELTWAPWEREPADGPLRQSDKYHYTRLLFTNQSLLQELLDRKIGWSGPVLVGMLHALEAEGVLQSGRKVWRPFFREANFMLGYRKLSALDTATCIDVFSVLAKSVSENDLEETDTLDGSLFDSGEGDIGADEDAAGDFFE